MVTECRAQFYTLAPEGTMSAKGANHSCNTLQTFNDIGLALNSMSNTIKNSLKCDKKVEVRWLDTEANLYIKKWERRYRQLEGIDDGLRRKSYLLEHYDDWYHTARSVLDLDVTYMNSKDYNKFNLENYDPSFDLLFNREDSNLLLNIDENFDTDYEFEFENGFMQFDTVTLDPSIELSPDILAALKSNNLALKNCKIDNVSCKRKGSEKEKSSAEKQLKKSHKALATVDIGHINVDEPNSQTSNDSGSFSKSGSPSKSPRKSLIVKTQRNRPPSTRRQMYTCEYPGCSYQSDRNFNFLRHKRTHGKQNKSEDIKKHHCGITVPSDLIYGRAKLHNLNGPQFVGMDMTTITDLNHLTQPATLLPNEISLNVAAVTSATVSAVAGSATSLSTNLNGPLSSLVQCQSVSLPETDPAFSLIGDDYIERQGLIIKDMNNLEHVLGENHFTNFSLEPTFLS